MGKEKLRKSDSQRSETDVTFGTTYASRVNRFSICSEITSLELQNDGLRFCSIITLLFFYIYIMNYLIKWEYTEKI